MRRPKRCGAPARPRVARPCMSRSSRARITARHPLVPTPSSLPAFRGSSRRWPIQTRRWRAPATGAWRRPASRSTSGSAPRRHAARTPAISAASPTAVRMSRSSLPCRRTTKGALSGRRPVQITGSAVRNRVHVMRAMSDAVLTGIGTVLSDDPLLTSRLPGMADRSPVRVVLDSDLRMPADARLVATARETPLWVVTGDAAPGEREQALQAAGVEVLRVPSARRRSTCSWCWNRSPAAASPG